MGRPTVPSGFRCYHCGSMETCKAGFEHRRRKRRFRCRACRTFFIENPEIKSGSSKKRWVKADLPSRARLMLELKAIGQEFGRAPTTDIIFILMLN